MLDRDVEHSLGTTGPRQSQQRRLEYNAQACGSTRHARWANGATFLCALGSSAATSECELTGFGANLECWALNRWQSATFRSPMYATRHANFAASRETRCRLAPRGM